MKIWLDIEYPAIEQRAQQENAEIAWGDESGLRSDAQRGRGYAPVGHTPEIQPNTQRVSVNLLYFPQIGFNSSNGASGRSLGAKHSDARRFSYR